MGNTGTLVHFSDSNKLSGRDILSVDGNPHKVLVPALEKGESEKDNRDLVNTTRMVHFSDSKKV